MDTVIRRSAHAGVWQESGQFPWTDDIYWRPEVQRATTLWSSNETDLARKSAATRCFGVFGHQKYGWKWALEIQAHDLIWSKHIQKICFIQHPPAATVVTWSLRNSLSWDLKSHFSAPKFIGPVTHVTASAIRTPLAEHLRCWGMAAILTGLQPFSTHHYRWIIVIRGGHPWSFIILMISRNLVSPLFMPGWKSFPTLSLGCLTGALFDRFDNDWSWA